MDTKSSNSAGSRNLGTECRYSCYLGHMRTLPAPVFVQDVKQGARVPFGDGEESEEQHVPDVLAQDYRSNMRGRTHSVKESNPLESVSSMAKHLGGLALILSLAVSS